MRQTSTRHGAIAAQYCLLLALAHLAGCQPLPTNNHDHLNLITAQSQPAQTSAEKPGERSIVDHMDLMSSKRLTSTPASGQGADATPITADDQLNWKRLLSDKLALPKSASFELESQNSAKFDHFDYVVSDLEFELVLKRLRRNVAPANSKSVEPESELERAQTESSAEDEQEQLSTTSSDENFRSSECFICLDEFLRDTEDKSGEPYSGPIQNEQLEAIVRLLCKHEFHRNCIAGWSRAKMASSRRCPLCMNLLRLSDGKLFEPNDQ